MIGVYLITCIPTGKRYIGSSVSLEKRWIGHKSALRRLVHENMHLQRSWNKYGEAAFKFDVLEECAPEELLKREQQWLDTERPEFNIAPQATAPMAGRKHSLRTLRKLRGRVMSAETRARMSESHKGKRLAYLTKLRILEGNLKCHHTPKARAKLAQVRLVLRALTE